MFKRAYGVVAVCLLISSILSADTILNTLDSAYGLSMNFSSDISRAFKFMVYTECTIESIVVDYDQTEYSDVWPLVTLNIYADAGGTPDVEAIGTYEYDSMDGDMVYFAGMSDELIAGEEYWLSFESLAGAPSYMFLTESPVYSGELAEFSPDENYSVNGEPGLSLSYFPIVELSGTVPEPATLSLIGAGITTLIMRRRR